MDTIQEKQLQKKQLMKKRNYERYHNDIEFKEKQKLKAKERSKIIREFYNENKKITETPSSSTENNFLKSIEELNLFKTTGLIEIAKRNTFFHGYWLMNRKDLIKNFKELIDNNIRIIIPDLDLKYYKEKYSKTFDYL